MQSTDEGAPDQSAGVAFNLYVVGANSCAATNGKFSISAERLSRDWNVPLDDIKKRLKRLKDLQDSGRITDNHWEHFACWLLKQARRHADKVQR